MATYVIGDIHGCWQPLKRLLKKIALDPQNDRLWLTGDLVNRGPDSLAVLRWARRMADEMGERFVTVLGNHDLHLLAVAAGVSEERDGDTLSPILKARDRKKLLGWLRQQPFLHQEKLPVGEGKKKRTILVHAGLRPEWTATKAKRQARRLKKVFPALLARKPENGEQDSPQRRALHAFTLLRTLTEDGEPCKFSGPLADVPKGCLPWFRHPRRRTAKHRVIFGHWAALGFHQEEGVLALDSGCVWGGRLTAVRLPDGDGKGEVFQVEAQVEAERD